MNKPNTYAFNELCMSLIVFNHKCKKVVRTFHRMLNKLTQLPLLASENQC